MSCAGVMFAYTHHTLFHQQYLWQANACRPPTDPQLAALAAAKKALAARQVCYKAI